MATNYVQEGKTLNYTAGADITSGQFVLIGTIGGVAKTDIVSGKTGAVHVCGVFSLPKASGAVTQGAKEIEGYLRSIGDVQFAGAMKEQAGTLNVALSNMGDAFRQAGESHWRCRPDRHSDFHCR
jgi:predicted RecA/RadA family phage recombinase